MVGGQRVEQLDLGARQPRVAEQRDALRQFGRGLLQRGNGFGVANVWWISVDAADQGTPQRWLPQQIVIDWGIDAVGAALPVDEQLGTLAGV